MAVSLGLLAAAGTAALVWNLLTPQWTAVAQLHIEAMPPWIVFPDKESSGKEFKAYCNLQMAKLKSRLLLNQVLKADDVQALPIVQQQPEPLFWLEDMILNEMAEGSEILKVTMSGADQNSPVIIINRLLQLYEKEVVEADLKRKRERLTQLDQIRVEEKEKVRKQRDLLHKLAEQLGTTDPGVLSRKQTELLTKWGDLTKQVSTLQTERFRAESRLKSHLARKPDLDKTPVPESVLNDSVAADPTVQVLTTQLNQWLLKQKQYENYAKSPQSEPGYIIAVGQAKVVKEAIEKRTEEVKQLIAPKFRQRLLAEWEVVRAQLEKDLEPLKDLEEALNKQVADLQEKVDKIGFSSAEIELLKADIAGDGKIFEKVADEYNALQIELNSRPRVTRLQDAALQKKDTKKLLAGMVVGPFGAFFAVVLAIGFVEFRARRVQTADEVATGLGVRVVGAVPPTGDDARRLLLNSDTDLSAVDPGLLESIDGIRTLLLRDASVLSTRVVMVSSAVAGEGKTALASQLASSLARAGRKTLLVDCDLRSPALHQLFELPLAPGFSEVLLGEVHLAEATRSTSVDGLWMIPAGQWDREVMAALARDGVGDVFDKLKSEYDFVIVDSHPVLSANDSQLIAQQADAVLLALLRDVSQTPRVYAACQRLQTLGARLLGAVVQGLAPEDAFGGRTAGRTVVRG
jgi:capsular exopolysaccharide synthesis family protein